MDKSLLQFVAEYRRGQCLRIGILVVVACVCHFSVPLAAQETDSDLKRQIEQLKEKVARDSGAIARHQKGATPLTPDKRLEEVKKSLAGGGVQTVSTALPENNAAQWNDVPHVTAHFKQRNGMNFPSPEEVVVPPVPTVLSVAPRNEPLVWESREQKPTRPPHCEKNRTVKSLRYPELDDTKLVHQEIYLSEDLLPLDAREVYGDHVELVSYGISATEGVLLRMKLDAVPCVPFRRRLTAAAIYEDTGRNALKNYDQKPSGEGVFHPWVEQKLFHGK